MQNGYVKLYRKLLENPIITKDSDYLAIWVYLLLNATHTKKDVIFKNERITLMPGQLITGRKIIAKKLRVNESKVERVLNLLKIEHQIEQQTSNQNRLISIIKWRDYQTSEQQNEQRVNNERTTSEQRVNTNNNDNNVNNVINNNINNKDKSVIINKYIVEIIDYLNKKTEQHYKTTTKKTISLINARLKEKFTLDDFKQVIDKKYDEWHGTDMEKYLRPETLFGTKFESYLNQKKEIKKYSEEWWDKL